MSSDLAADIVRAAKKADDRGGGHVAIAVAVLRILERRAATVTDRDRFPVCMLEIDVPFHDGKPPLSHNQRLHWREKAQRTRNIRDHVSWRVKAAKLPQQRRITVQLHYAPQDNRRRDAPNLTATSKPAIDGLVDAGLVPDDNDAYVTELMPVIHPADGCARRLWLAIHIDTPEVAA